MDLRNLCSKLDMDAIRAKIPPLPNMVTHMKLPKSMSKLKSRKIFRSSREDVNSAAQRSSSKRIPPAAKGNIPLPLGPPYTIPPSEFINRTPTRISTISSLMNESGGGGGSSKTKSQNKDENFYRSAGGIDDYYPSPLSQRFEQRLSRPISPVKPPSLIQQEYPTQSEQNIKMSFAERVQKGYKDVSSFRLKHIFAKKTVVRKDNIEVTNYARRYDEDRQRDDRVQERRDRHIADNYRFQFKESNKNSEESLGNSPTESPRNQEITKKIPKSLSELSGDESGMESSPPKRKPGIAATRFSKVRSPPLNMSLEEDDDDSDGINENIYLDEEEEFDNPKPNTSSLFELRKQKSSDKSQVPHHSPQKSTSFKERMSRFTKQRSNSDETKKETEKKRRAPLSPQQSEEQEEAVSNPTQPEKPFDVIKHNFKRLQKSMKLPQQSAAQSGAESENEDQSNQETKQKLTKTQQITERLKRFRSVDNVDKGQDEDENKTIESPIRKIKQKLIEWKKSIKNHKPTDNYNTENDDEDEPASPQKRDRPVGTLIKKLKHIRSRKHASTDDPDEDEEGGDTYKESLKARAKLQLEKSVVAASQVPQRTMKKISETKKYFRKNREQDGNKKSDKTKTDDEDENDEDEQKDKNKNVQEFPAAKIITRPPPPIPRPYYRDSSDEDEADDDDDGGDYHKKITIETTQIAAPTTARTAWTTKPILSDDTTDYDDEVPRVLIHQDNSDIFESTLIIAVTRPKSHTSTPIITELPPDYLDEDSTPDTKPDNWIPNTERISSFLEITPPSHRKNSKDSNATSYSKRHSRKQSMESSSEDSWIKDVPRDVSNAVGLNSVHENEEAWKIKSVKEEEKLYKTKSIDIFEFHHKNGGGALTAFEDFDDELKNTPIVKIDESKLIKIHLNAVSFERDSSEELDNADDDNSSRVTKISVHPPKDIPKKEQGNLELELKSQLFGNSRESLMGNLDSNDVLASGEEEEDNEDSDNGDEDEEDDYDDDDEEENDSHPPSKAPSPPPSISPPPPPLPQRQPSIRLSKLSQSSLEISCPPLPPPPLPATKPPIPPNRPTAPPPPKIPERTPSLSHISKPLVKTSSLRLAYSEQVNPQDVGKVNKLISRFEPNGGPKQRPRIIPRKPYMASESEEYSDNEEEEEEEEQLNEIDLIRKEKRDRTPTNQPRMQKSFSIDSADIPKNSNNNINSPNREATTILPRKATSQIILDNSTSVMSIPSISISSSCLDVNSNFSQPNSVYGSPLTYPSSLVGSREVTPLTSRRDSDFLVTRRNRRSMQRDDENFYSFDSDEENSYYSISSTSSNRYVVEL